MATYKCNLCSHEYDEAIEKTIWDELPDDWICPVCGSKKADFSLFIVHTESIEAPVVDASIAGSKYQCGLCSYIYDEEKAKVLRKDLPEDWVCPVCGSDMSNFAILKQQKVEAALSVVETVDKEYLAEWVRQSDEIENYMADIHNVAVNGVSIIEPMRTRMPTFSWDEILIKGAQLAKLPINGSAPVSIKTTIGPASKVPLIIESPMIVSHMSFGALSREAKMALSKGSAIAKTAMSSGEGGILPESLEAAYKYIFEYVPNKYSVTDEYLKKVDAVEIKIGQSAKPGMGGHLPGHKVTQEIAAIRGFREGRDIVSPSHFPDIRCKDDLRITVDHLRDKTLGKPIGVKLAAGSLEYDIAIALYAGVDFITIDGRAGGTGAAPKVVKNATSIPTIFALSKAREILNSAGASNVSLIITGGFRVSSDVAKALAMGADAVAVGTAAMMALGCQQYKICNTGNCPLGIATQDPALRARLDIDKSAARVANFFKVYSDELKTFARLTGNSKISGIGVEDLCTTNSEVSNFTEISHV